MSSENKDHKVVDGFGDESCSRYTGGVKSVAKKLRSGAPFLVYLYYAFD
jgi:hypothetical protein